MSPLEGARWWIERKFHPIPIPYQRKKPVEPGWPELRVTDETAPQYFNGKPLNIGVILGDELGSADVDLDTIEAVRAGPVLLPDTNLVFGRASKPASHHFYRADPGVPYVKYIDPMEANEDEATIVELRGQKKDGGTGFQTVVPPSVHESGEPIYFERDGHAANIDADVLRRAVAKVAAAALFAKHFPKPKSGRNDAFLAIAGTLARAGWQVDEAVDFNFAIYKAIWGEQADYDACRSEVEPTFRKLAEGAEITGIPKLIERMNEKVVKTALEWLCIESTRSGGVYLWNDSGNADRLADRHGDDLIYCPERKGYYVWSGQRWEFDERLEVEKRADETMRAAYAEAGKIADEKNRKDFLKFVSGSLSRNSLANMVHLCKKMVRYVSAVEFDADAWSLNVESGTIDLRTGELRPHRRDDLISKLIPLRYDPAAECPLFIRSLWRIMGDGPDASEDERDRAGRMVEYLQRLFGCATTGKPEKLLVFLHGARGNNGKTTLLETVAKALGGREYSTRIKVDSLMANPRGFANDNATNTDLSDLQGARFAYTDEVEKGQRLSLARVKDLAGLGLFKARRMRENCITFAPTHKLFLDANHRPEISSPTDPVWNRVKCVPFEVELSADEIDTDFHTKLEAELPGVLAWLVAGAREYFREGLRQCPPEVLMATAAYQADSDRLKEFLAECCTFHKEAWISTADVVKAYGDWCHANGEKFPLVGNDFTDALRAKGCKPKTKEVMRKKVRGWAGIGPLNVPESKGCGERE